MRNGTRAPALIVIVGCSGRGAGRLEAWKRKGLGGCNQKRKCDITCRWIRYRDFDVDITGIHWSNP